MIIVAGEKAYPREIEDVLMRHPTVAEAAVMGKKDAGRGEVVVAFVIAREGQSVKGDDLREFSRQQGLAQWKVPREVIVVPDFPTPHRQSPQARAGGQAGGVSGANSAVIVQTNR